ncbi:uncharacterized protein EAF02_004832 [Botrytis sinoallii]|uniref:uncharacterized protein n=1 Tax=Botrytis sinoallii TaxID=1463999 RepID=UPI0019014E36|nr:uncharacterized protein EAF02_004832 [Botrytis sinoallii]KAF7884496.1 hypothetical protein EAF02_004832 [Botrytis sinoallii]
MSRVGMKEKSEAELKSRMVRADWNPFRGQGGNGGTRSVEDEVNTGKRGQNTSRGGRMEVVVETCSIIRSIMKHDDTADASDTARRFHSNAPLLLPQRAISALVIDGCGHGKPNHELFNRGQNARLKRCREISEM